MYRQRDVTNSVATSEQFDSAQLISSRTSRKHLMGRRWPSGRMFDFDCSYDMFL